MPFSRTKPLERFTWALARARFKMLAACGAVLACTASQMPPAYAVFSGDMSPRVRSGDSDYADGMEAWDAKNWDGVIVAMRKVVARRPWHDNAWTRLGFALRKTGRYDESLAAYDKALTLNPHHREALEYLGEAYLSLDRLSDARTVLARLDDECKRVALVFTDGDFRNGCGEYKDLKGKLESYVTTGKRPPDSNWGGPQKLGN